MSIPSSCNVVFYDSFELIVLSPHGTVHPHVGPHMVSSLDTTRCYSESPPPSNGVQFVCIGWTGTGSVPASGEGTNVTFTITEDSTLTWNWKTQMLVSISATGGNCAFGSQWIDKDETVEATVVPAFSSYRLLLSGDTNGVAVSGTVLSIPADGPRNIAVTVQAMNPEREPFNGVEWSYVTSVLSGTAILHGGEGQPAIPASTAGAVLVPETLGGVPVAEIGEKAFAGCSGVTRLLFTGDAPATVADDAFEGLPEGCTVHVRKGSTGWGNALPGTWHGLPVSDDLLFVEATAAGGGGVSGGGFYAEGDEVSLAAAAETGSVFSHWSGDVAGTEPAKRFEIAQDTTATATFIPESAADKIVADRAETNGYYTMEQLRGLAAGDLLIDLDAATGSARIGVKLEESDDLSDPDSWRPVEFTAADLDVGEDGSVGLRVKTDDNVRFFRLVVP